MDNYILISASKEKSSYACLYLTFNHNGSDPI